VKGGEKTTIRGGDKTEGGVFSTGISRKNLYSLWGGESRGGGTISKKIHRGGVVKKINDCG